MITTQGNPDNSANLTEQLNPEQGFLQRSNGPPRRTNQSHNLSDLAVSIACLLSLIQYGFLLSMQETQNFTSY